MDIDTLQELYEPLWEHLYLELKRQGIRIRQIFMADCAWQGQSGILNKDKLGNDRMRTLPLRFCFGP